MKSTSYLQMISMLSQYMDCEIFIEESDAINAASD